MSHFRWKWFFGVHVKNDIQWEKKTERSVAEEDWFPIICDIKPKTAFLFMKQWALSGVVISVKLYVLRYHL